MSVNKNGKAYDSGDVRVFINGIPINVKEISYSSEQEHQVNHSLSNYATSFSQGKVSHSGSITLFMQEASMLEESAPGGRSDES